MYSTYFCLQFLSANQNELVFLPFLPNNFPNTWYIISEIPKNVCEVNECLQAIKENWFSTKEDRRESVIKHARILEIVDRNKGRGTEEFS